MTSQREKKVREWIEKCTQQQLGTVALRDALHDSKLLCRLANYIEPNSINEALYQEEEIPDLQAMENIGLFVDNCRRLGVPEASLFRTADLFEGNNMDKVVTCLAILRHIVEKEEGEVEEERIAVPNGFHIPKPTTSLDREGDTNAERGKNRHALLKSFPLSEFVLSPLLLGVSLGFGIKVGRSLFKESLHRALLRVGS